MKIQLTEKQLKNIVLNETRTEESLTKRGKVIYTAIKKGQMKISISNNKTISGELMNIQIEGMADYVLPDEYNILLHTVSNPIGDVPNVMSIRYMIDNKIQFDFTGSIVITDSTNNIVSNTNFNKESSQRVPYLKKSYYYLLRQLSYSVYRRYGVTIQESVHPSVEINETRTEESFTKRSNILYKALKNGKFGFTFFDMVYDKLSVYTSEVLFKGMIEYSLPDNYSTELIKDEDTFRLGIKRSGYNHIRYYIKEEPEFRFTGKMKITNIDNDDEYEEEFTNEPIHNINHLSYHKINKRMNKFLEQHYNVTVKKTNNTYDNLNEGSHSTKELSKLIDWAMKKMDCYVVRTTNGIKICPPEHIKEPCYVAHFSDKAVRPLMAAISKWFGSTKYDVERAYGANQIL
jgi:hypothetical protein